MNITGNTVVGNLGTGTLNVETGAEVYAVDLTVGDPAGVAISSGLLQVAGDFQPDAIAATRSGR